MQGLRFGGGGWGLVLGSTRKVPSSLFDVFVLLGVTLAISPLQLLSNETYIPPGMDPTAPMSGYLECLKRMDLTATTRAWISYRGVFPAGVGVLSASLQ